MRASEQQAQSRSPPFTSRVALATGTLLIAIASHSVRETARDALFLGGLPAASLPYAYLIIACGAILVGVANRFLLDRVSHRLLLVGTLVSATGVDLLFWQISARPSAETLFALYAWTGLLATAITMQLWLHLAEVFDVEESKRAFPLIAAGGLVGAALGSALSGALLFFVDTHDLLLASGGLLLVASCVASALPARDGAAADGEEELRRSAGLAATLCSSYPLRITLLAVSVAVLATGIDFVFKHTVAASVPSEMLGRVFAWIHTAINSAALLFELVVASWALRRLGVTRTLMILPCALLVAVQCFVAMPALFTAMAQKFVDGTLRPSLHQAGTEVLFQPLSPQTRNTVKTLVESLGKRGGQALASLGILVASGLQVDLRWIALGLMPVAGASLVASLGLRRDYIERFRERLSGLAEEARVRLPRLDLHSLEALVANLSSPDDSQVLAAIDLLERYRRTSLVPPLLLYHPSVPVVLRALELFRNGSHPFLEGILHRLLEHSDEDVRSASLDALVATGSADVPLERMLRGDPSAKVRSTAVVALASRRADDGDLITFVRGLLANGTPEERVAVARSLPRLPGALAAPLARETLAGAAAPVAKALAFALAQESSLPASSLSASSLSADWDPVLIDLIARRDTRAAARVALVGRGAAGLRALETALDDPETDPVIRRHLPRSIHRFGSARAAEILMRNLEGAPLGVHFKILRGLGRMRTDDPDLEVDEALVEREAGLAMDRAVEMLGLRVACFLWAGAHPGPDAGRSLLGRMLADEEARSLERSFRALHVLDPKAEFDAIFETLHAGNAERAEGLELVRHLVPEDLRDGLLALTSRDAAAAKLERACRQRALAPVSDLVPLLPSEPAEDSSWITPELLQVLERCVDRLRDDPDPVLREVARCAFGRERSASPVARAEAR